MHPIIPIIIISLTGVATFLFTPIGEAVINAIDPNAQKPIIPQQTDPKDFEDIVGDLLGQTTSYGKNTILEGSQQLDVESSPLGDILGTTNPEFQDVVGGLIDFGEASWNVFKKLHNLVVYIIIALSDYDLTYFWVSVIAGIITILLFAKYFGHLFKHGTRLIVIVGTIIFILILLGIFGFGIKI